MRAKHVFKFKKISEGKNFLEQFSNFTLKDRN